MKLEGKSFIVTGAARGIGAAIVERLLHEGARVVLSDVDVAAGEATTSALSKQGEVRFFRCDVGEAKDAAALIAHAVTAFGEVNGLVNNAGIVHAADVLELAEADFDRVLRVNLKGAFLVSQQAARHMVAQGKGGAIVNMSSVNARLAIPNQLPYAVSKGGLSQLTNVMAVALAPHGIRVNAIGPGSIMTDMLKTIAVDTPARHKLLSRTPLGRIGEPGEIASVAAFLLSEDASYITGQTIYADGGRMGLNYTVPVDPDA